MTNESPRWTLNNYQCSQSIVSICNPLNTPSTFIYKEKTFIENLFKAKKKKGASPSPNRSAKVRKKSRVRSGNLIIQN